MAKNMEWSQSRCSMDKPKSKHKYIWYESNGIVHYTYYPKKDYIIEDGKLKYIGTEAYWHRPCPKKQAFGSREGTRCQRYTFRIYQKNIPLIEFIRQDCKRLNCTLNWLINQLLIGYKNKRERMGEEEELKLQQRIEKEVDIIQSDIDTYEKTKEARVYEEYLQKQKELRDKRLAAREAREPFRQKYIKEHPFKDKKIKEDIPEFVKTDGLANFDEDFKITEPINIENDVLNDLQSIPEPKPSEDIPKPDPINSK